MLQILILVVRRKLGFLTFPGCSYSFYGAARIAYGNPTDESSTHRAASPRVEHIAALQVCIPRILFLKFFAYEADG
jgi:hypothetical protein